MPCSACPEFSDLKENAFSRNLQNLQLPRYHEDLTEIRSGFDAFKKLPDIAFNNLKVIKLNNYRGSKSDNIGEVFAAECCCIAVFGNCFTTKGYWFHHQKPCRVKEWGWRFCMSNWQCYARPLLLFISPICEYFEDDGILKPMHVGIYCQQSLYSAHESSEPAEPTIHDYFTEQNKILSCNLIPYEFSTD